jgi:hypothetical protein
MGSRALEIRRRHRPAVATAATPSALTARLCRCSARRKTHARRSMDWPKAIKLSAIKSIFFLVTYGNSIRSSQLKSPDLHSSEVRAVVIQLIRPSTLVIFRFGSRTVIKRRRAWRILLKNGGSLGFSMSNVNCTRSDFI